MKGVLHVLVLLLFAVVTNGQGNETWIEITPTWKVTQTQINNFIAILPRLNEDTWAWHWGTEVNSLRWDRQGFVDQGEVDWYNDNDSGMAQGGGFYISLDQTDSRPFGVFPVGVLLKKGSLRFEGRNYTMRQEALTALGKTTNFSLKELTQLGRIVPFYDLYTHTWIVVHNATLLQTVTLAFKLPGFLPTYGSPAYEFQQSTGGFYPVMEQISNFSSRARPLVQEMRRHWALLDFLGPLQANRMRLEHGKELWKKIDIEKFDRFFKTIDDFTRELYQSTYSTQNPLESIGTKTFGSYAYDEGIWRSEMIDKVFPLIWNSFNGKGKNQTLFRDEASFNEGDETVKYYNIVSGEYNEIQASPYLNVEVLEKNSANGTLKVKIEHPSVLNIKKFMHMLSPELQKNISYYSHAKLRQDDALRREFNLQIMKELLGESLSRVYRAEWDSLEAVRFFQDLKRIQPFASDNNLMRKMFERLSTVAMMRGYTANSKLEVYPEITSFIPFYFCYRSQMDSISFYELRLDGYRQLSRAAFDSNLEVDYFVGWSNFTRDYLTFSENTFTFDSKALQMLKEQRMSELLDRDLPKWRDVISQNLDIKVTPNWYTSQSQLNKLKEILPKANQSLIYIWMESAQALESVRTGRLGAAFRNGNPILSVQVVPYQMPNSNSFMLPVVAEVGKGVGFIDISVTRNRTVQKLIESVLQLPFDEMNFNLLIPLGSFITVDMYRRITISNTTSMNDIRIAYNDSTIDFPYSATNYFFEGGVLGEWKFLLESKNITKGEAIGDIMARYWSLLDFAGTLQANRLRIQYGDQLWDHIDKNQFDRFHSAQFRMIKDSIEGKGLYFGSFGRFFAYQDVGALKNLTEAIFGSIWGNMTGGNESMFREEESWNNGRGTNVTFTVIPKQLMELNGSPYLQVEVVSRNETDDTYQVRFQHPTVYNVTKLHNANKISNELYSNISSYSKSELDQNASLRRDLTVRLMKELVDIFFTEMYNQNLYGDVVFSNYINLERIQPFKRDNHLMRKIFEKLAMISLGGGQYNSFPESAPESVTMMPSHVYYYSGYYSNGGVNRIRTGGMDNMIRSYYQNKPVDYFVGWNTTLPILYVGSSSYTVPFNDQTMKWIEEAEYVKLFDHVAYRWRNLI